ncbi:exopolysaccharide biosynthesis polyprenyl glycosylphosphotransferase [Motilibacter peucedani]|uniref:Exopolysaccharide biosynthesis polyprenyl glycosylphosphotransferase n=1 Tax=Motilibacter peucedani TaxID=598650 RepID=A0A420XL93_9ACTN|nr:sugar transferase [Motilibacter peucedani]RKS68607.1 exopolysaccharide biosynthesis polyprenyl glycosylphosphotransferase [Motilibacter peucedani]
MSISLNRAAAAVALLDVDLAGARVPALPRQRLRGWQRVQLASVLSADVVAVVASYALGRDLFARDPSFGTVRDLLALPAAWLVLAALNGAYDLRAMGTGVLDHKRVLNAGLHLVALVGLASTLPDAHSLREVLPLVAAAPVAVLVARHVCRMALSIARRRGLAVRRVLVIGEPSAAFPLASRLERTPSSGLQVVGVCSTAGIDRRAGREPGPGSERRRNAPPRVLGTLESAALLARREAVDVVAVAHSPGLSSEALRDLSWQLEESHVEMLVAPALVDVAGPRITVEPVAGLPLLHIAKPEFSTLRRVVKGTGDRVLALLGLLALSPLLLVVAVMVRRDSPGPVLFRQPRVGQGGHEFPMLKFRSMYVDAEARLEEVRVLNQHGEGPLFKSKDDPRVTRVGAFLRRWSIDELPQLINVLRGEMSLVGPRPPLPREVAAYDQPSIFRRLMVKPGLTGLWQVSGRADLSWQEAVRLDLYYVENWSPALDASILWRTLGAVTKGSGAY